MLTQRLISIQYSIWYGRIHPQRIQKTRKRGERERERDEKQGDRSVILLESIFAI